jgi:hypothetical protein
MNQRQAMEAPFGGRLASVERMTMRTANGIHCGHLLGGEDLVVRWYTRMPNAASLLKVAVTLAALVSLVVGAGADWRWD